MIAHGVEIVDSNHLRELPLDANELREQATCQDRTLKLVISPYC